MVGEISPLSPAYQWRELPGQLLVMRCSGTYSNRRGDLKEITTRCALVVAPQQSCNKCS